MGRGVPETSRRHGRYHCSHRRPVRVSLEDPGRSGLATCAERTPAVRPACGSAPPDPTAHAPPVPSGARAPHSPPHATAPRTPAGLAGVVGDSYIFPPLFVVYSPPRSSLITIGGGSVEVLNEF